MVLSYTHSPDDIGIHDLAHIHGMEVPVRHRIASIHIPRIHFLPYILREFAQFLILSLENPALNRQGIRNESGSQPQGEKCDKNKEKSPPCSYPGT